MSDRMKAIYDKLAQEGGGTWATYMMMDIQEALAAQQDGVREVRRTLWLVVKSNGGYMLERHDMEDYPGGDRTILTSVRDEETGDITLTAEIGGLEQKVTND